MDETAIMLTFAQTKLGQLTPGTPFKLEGSDRRFIVASDPQVRGDGHLYQWKHPDGMPKPPDDKKFSSGNILERAPYPSDQPYQWPYPVDIQAVELNADNTVKTVDVHLIANFPTMEPTAETPNLTVLST